MKRGILDEIIDRVFYGAAAMVIFYILKKICLANGFFVFAGINPLTFLTVTILGIPGFLLVFAIALLRFF